MPFIVSNASANKIIIAIDALDVVFTIDKALKCLILQAKITLHQQIKINKYERHSS